MKRYSILLLLVLCFCITGLAQASTTAGVGMKVANSRPRLALFASWEPTDTLTFSGNVMRSDPKGIVALWEAQAMFGTSAGYFVGARAVNVSLPGHGLTLGPAMGVWGATQSADWSLEGYLGAAHLNEPMLIWDVGLRRSVGMLSLEVGIQQQRFHRVETWPRIAAILTF